LRHQPAREYSTTARTALERDASIILLLFLSGHTRYHAHHGFAVKEDLFDKVIEAVSLNVVLEIETHALDKGVVSKRKSVAVGEVRLDVDYEVFVLWPFLVVSGQLH